MKQLSPISSDVQAQTDHSLMGLQWVGMGQIQSACLIHNYNVPCFLDLGVNLKSGFRGIHMSRLYQAHLDLFLQQSLNSENLKKFLTEALKSQDNISTEITAKLNLQYPMKTQSLKSMRAGFRNYPVQIIAVQTQEKKFQNWLRFEVLYSSTCPQSASLSMEMLNSLQQIPATLPGTPHAQRSRAVISLQLQDISDSKVEKLITTVESLLGTPVQTVVKKVDEMEFARLNAENLMFCEDAVRSIAAGLLMDSTIFGFSIFCEHQESLHPHNASSFFQHQWVPPQNLSFH